MESLESVFDPLQTLDSGRHTDDMTRLTRLGFLSVACLLGCTSPAPTSALREDFAQRGEIFVEVFDSPSNLEQIREELSSRNWRVDCVGYNAARPFLRVQLPAGATYEDIESVMHLPGRSTMRMVYETQPKERCPATRPQ